MNWSKSLIEYLVLSLVSISLTHRWSFKSSVKRNWMCEMNCYFHHCTLYHSCFSFAFSFFHIAFHIVSLISNKIQKKKKIRAGFFFERLQDSLLQNMAHFLPHIFSKLFSSFFSCRIAHSFLRHPHTILISPLADTIFLSFMFLKFFLIFFISHFSSSVG